MTRILADDGDTIPVEAGVVLEHLNRRLRSTGRYFPPDPATAAVTTTGGMIATNAAGSHSTSVGTTRDHVRQIHAVTIGGESFDASRELRGTAGGDGRTTSDDAARAGLYYRLAALLREHADLIESKRPLSRRNNCGYHLWDVLAPASIDLAGLLTGSEGT